MDNQLLEGIQLWIEQTLKQYQDQKVSCISLAPQLYGYFDEEFLSRASFVVVPVIPLPAFHETKLPPALQDFLDDDYAGMTYKSTYFIKETVRHKYWLHLHELVHVVQWQLLGVRGFLERYISEVSRFTYENAPLEKMAQKIELNFKKKMPPIDVLGLVQRNL